MQCCEWHFRMVRACTSLSVVRNFAFFDWLEEVVCQSVCIKILLWQLFWYALWLFGEIYGWCMAYFTGQTVKVCDCYFPFSSSFYLCCGRWWWQLSECCVDVWRGLLLSHSFCTVIKGKCRSWLYPRGLFFHFSRGLCNLRWNREDEVQCHH